MRNKLMDTLMAIPFVILALFTLLFIGGGLYFAFKNGDYWILGVVVFILWSVASVMYFEEK